MPFKKSKCLEQQFVLLKNRALRNFIIDYMEQCVPDYFYVVPASSTGKYHPKYALGPGGLVRHTMAAVYFAETLLSLEQNKSLSWVWHDEIIAALIIHDSFKQGLVNKKGQRDGHTKFEHPLMAANALLLFAKEVHPEMQEEAKLIASLVASHMGQWNRSERSRTILPKPQSDAEKFVHMCDYLASRQDITVSVNYEPKTEEQTE